MLTIYNLLEAMPTIYWCNFVNKNVCITFHFGNFTHVLDFIPGISDE